MSGTITTRITALLAAALLATAAALTGASAASADDLAATSDDTLAEIEATPWPEYSMGDVDADILAAKLLITEQGFDPGAEDAEFDGEFRAAVLNYQAANDLEDSGTLNAETWLLLREQTFGEYGPGSRGNVVRAVQHLINAKFEAHLGVDGIYGPDTEDAVRWVQDFFGIGVDGITGEYTFRALVTYQDYDR
ncbi:peptidoglycan-binding domain-containing protein [Nocardiopsis changdeensis]|uniref:peptidoglycan-binding domain-containing protein n=1 Tax=Nocardiopsis changdeensis TaxID=2831969 RepID=UPI003F456941